MRAEEVIQAVAELCRHFSAVEVILFGSRAKGTARERSDIDVAVSGVKDFDALAEAKQRDLSDSFVLSGTSAKFSITFDLAWKVMKDILIQYYAITGFVTGSPREVLKQSFRANLITGDEWIEMLKVKNQLAHDYDGVIVKEHCQTIIHEYIDKLYDFKTVVETLLKEDK